MRGFQRKTRVERRIVQVAPNLKSGAILHILECPKPIISQIKTLSFFCIFLHFLSISAELFAGVRCSIDIPEIDNRTTINFNRILLKSARQSPTGSQRREKALLYTSCRGRVYVTCENPIPTMRSFVIASRWDFRRKTRVFAKSIRKTPQISCRSEK